LAAASSIEGDIGAGVMLACEERGLRRLVGRNHLLGRDEVKGKGSSDTERHGNGGGPPFSGVAAECNSNQGCA